MRKKKTTKKQKQKKNNKKQNKKKKKKKKKKQQQKNKKQKTKKQKNKTKHLGMQMTCIACRDSICFVNYSRMRCTIYGLGFSDIQAAFTLT